MGTNYSLSKSPRYLEERFGAEFERDFEGVYHVSAYENPSMPVISDEEPGKFSFFSWGLIPFWTGDEEKAEDIRTKTVNARADTIFEKPSFRTPVRERRCLIVMDGYFEWRNVDGIRYPYYIHKEGKEAFAVAGIWDEWSGGGEELRTYSMISIDANPFIGRVNNEKKRMPVIFPEGAERRWIQPGLEREETESMLRTYEGEDLRAYPVKKLISRRGIDSDVPEVLEEHEYEGLPDLDEEDRDGLRQSKLF